jgi:hypothetical protein
MCSFALDKPNSNMNQIPIAILFSPCRIPHVIANPGWLIAVIGLIPGIPLAPNDAILTAAALLCPLRGDGTPSLIILGTSTRENLPSILGSLPSIPLVPVLAFPGPLTLGLEAGSESAPPCPDSRKDFVRTEIWHPNRELRPCPDRDLAIVPQLLVGNLQGCTLPRHARLQYSYSSYL